MVSLLFASGFPKAFFFDCEDRTLHISGISRDSDDGVNISKLQNWDELITVINELVTNDFETIVFDGVTKLQDFVWTEVGKQLNHTNPRNIAYGLGYAKAG